MDTAHSWSIYCFLRLESPSMEGHSLGRAFFMQLFLPTADSPDYLLVHSVTLGFLTTWFHPQILFIWPPFLSFLFSTSSLLHLSTLLLRHPRCNISSAFINLSSFCPHKKTSSKRAEIFIFIHVTHYCIRILKHNTWPCVELVGWDSEWKWTATRIPRMWLALLFLFFSQKTTDYPLQLF